MSKSGSQTRFIVRSGPPVLVPDEERTPTYHQASQLKVRRIVTTDLEPRPVTRAALHHTSNVNLEIVQPWLHELRRNVLEMKNTPATRRSIDRACFQTFIFPGAQSPSVIPSSCPA
jgi:hypothetical protein